MRTKYTIRHKTTLGAMLHALVVTAVIMPLAGSCTYTALVRDTGHEVTVDIVYDWGNAPEACPEGMCIFFYNEDGSGYDRWDFTATKAEGAQVQGGQVRLPAGTYNVITYNNDTEAVLFSGTNGFDTHLAYTREGDVFEPVYGNSSDMSSSGSRADDDVEERVVISPDMIWGAWATQVTIRNDSSLTLYPQELVCSYTYEVRNITNINYASLMSGTLSGLAPSEYLGTWELGDETVTVPFSGLISMDDATMTGGFYTFGNNEADNAPHVMTFYVWLTNGEKYSFAYSVTEQVDGTSDPKHVHIVIDGMELPVAISNGDGFDPSVDDWHDNDYEIVL